MNWHKILTAIEDEGAVKTLRDWRQREAERRREKLHLPNNTPIEAEYPAPNGSRKRMEVCNRMKHS